MRTKQTVLIAILLPTCLLLFTVIVSACSYDDLSESIPLREAIHVAVLNQLAGNTSGEAKTEGHVILSVSQANDGNIIAYVVANYATYGFKKGFFTVKSGSVSIPAVIKFAKTSAGYSMLSYKEPADGEGNVESTMNFFPIMLWPKVQNSDHYYDELLAQQEEQAAEYLKSIGRIAEIHSEFIDVESFHISDEAYNQLIGIPELCEYPSFIGSIEAIENGMRYIFEACEEDFPGYHVITYTKKLENGDTLHQYRYKVSGNAVERIK